MLAYVGLHQTLKDLKARAGSLRSFSAIRKEAGPFCGFFPRKGDVFDNVESIQNWKFLEANFCKILQTEGKFVRLWLDYQKPLETIRQIPSGPA